MIVRLVTVTLSVLGLACATGSSLSGNRCFVTPEHQDRLGALLDEARLMPVFLEGRIYGQRFSRIDPGTHFDQLGFQVGDIILSVDGDRVEGTEASTYLLCVLGGTASAQIEVERNGEPLTLTFRPAPSA